jgi:hypothetical protein
MGAKQLGATIVKRYVVSYVAESVTQSLLDLDHAPATAKAVDALGRALIAALEEGDFGAIAKAARDTQRFDLKDFLDLGDLAIQLGKRCKSDAVRKGAKAILASLEDLVAAERHKGAGVGRASGVSIYCPVIIREAELVYERLAFAKSTPTGTSSCARTTLRERVGRSGPARPSGQARHRPRRVRSTRQRVHCIGQAFRYLSSGTRRRRWPRWYHSCV